ncbi:protein kinase superfamily protein [Actinidia rufa]|uniref:non-specific serine/threonine protein kinase n=1 Tax=Actinidia rufa TaxID=165716 RepID=A0A7J0GWP3_9ERIC|nr:protein kinase superfamily protein [Actinidia rufa]
MGRDAAAAGTAVSTAPSRPPEPPPRPSACRWRRCRLLSFHPPNNLLPKTHPQANRPFRLLQASPPLLLRHPPPSHILLRRSHRLGQGGFGSVFSGALGSREVAVKLMDAGSLQGEREFQNELFFAGRIECDYVVSVVGFSSDRKRRRMLLVYELMSNGSLQDCLLHRKCTELKEWKKRFAIAIDIAKGLEYLHHYCDPPVIHGDVKPSNILLNRDFNAKIGDFGLARLKSEDQCEISIINGSEGKKETGIEDNGSVIEETESVTTVGFDEINAGLNQSPESFVRGKCVAESVNDGGEKKSERPVKKRSGKDWWWKQDNGGAESGGVVKDYVMEWIGNEIKKERPKSDWIGASSSSGKSERKKNRKRLDWWMTLDEEKDVKKEKRRPAREWWKEEYCEELARKKKKKKQGQGSVCNGNNSETWWPMTDEDLYADRKKKKRSRSRSSRSSVDWWLDGLSGELWRARGNSHDSASGEIPKSGGISSTPSMRGTVCYIAPECGGGGDLSEKCDVYSFGVLLLVLIAGRRPLQVTGSPMSEFQRANLISWARHLARAGKLIDLVDQSIQSFDQEQALLGITVALLCLQKSPARRPSMKEVVGMLSGELESPQLPIEFSPSPPSRFPFKSRKKVR